MFETIFDRKKNT